jgi:endonuclease/exonuclease/phosphatase (EEP) superfamily protein YafD
MRAPPGTPKRIPWLARLLLLGLVGLGLASLAGALAPIGWPFELFVHFRAQYGVAAVILAAGLFFVRRPAAAALAVLLAVAQFWPAAARLQAGEPATRCDGDPFTVVTANLAFDNEDRQSLLAWLERDPGDLIVLQELTPAWAAALEGLHDYPHRTQVTRADPYGIGILSRWPLQGLTARDFAGDGLPSLVGYVDAGHARLHVAALHTHWPLLPELMRKRDRVLDRLAAEVRAESMPTIVAGDFNLTPHSPAYRRLLDRAGLRETMPAGAWRPTWHAGFWPLALRIDHVFVSSGLCVESAVVGPEFGSDHRPVRVRLRLPAAR